MFTCPEVHVEVQGQLGLLTLDRAKALNALSLPMIRALTAALLRWRDDPAVKAVAIRGSDKSGPFGHFCAGGDIRFFHQAGLQANPQLEDFFTEEYSLNHLIHSYPKPYLAFMDGIVMGGGMGLSQGARLRLVTERTKMGMPETNIGLFPDVGGGYFLSRCPGHTGEWLGMTGELIGAGLAIELGLADACLDAAHLPEAWKSLSGLDFSKPDALKGWLAQYSVPPPPHPALNRTWIDRYFAQGSATEVLLALEAAQDESQSWALHTASGLRKRSALMLHVTLEHIRRARGMSLAQNLRMERDMVRHCFFTEHLDRFGTRTETMEGIRALAVDKDHQPKWAPARIEEVTPAMVLPFFESPWPDHAHPLRGL